MSNKTCERCCKIFKFPYMLKKHLMRKYPCKELKKNLPQLTSINLNLPHLTSLNLTENCKDFTECEFCKESISKKNIRRHLRNNCLKIPKDKKNQIIEKYNKHKRNKNNQIAIVNNTTNNISINNTTNIINNNITFKINPLGQENIDFLKKEDILYVINRCYMGIPVLIKMIHNRPENRNFYIPNFNKNTMAYLNKKNEIIYDDYDKICEFLINKNIRRLDKYFRKFENELKESIKERMLNVVRENDNEELNDKYVEDIKFYLMSITKKNKKELHKFMDNIEKKIKK